MNTSPKLSGCAQGFGLGAILLSSLLAGCVSNDQLGQVRTFATATCSFSTQANCALTQLDGSFVDRNIAEVAHGDKAVSDATFVGVLDGTAGYKATEDAIKALGNYATAINALANAGYKTDIDQAATNLYGALTSINTGALALDPHAPQVSTADLGIVAQAVVGIGEIVAQEKQGAAIKVAVEKADPAIQSMCKGMAATFAGVRTTYRKNLDIIYTEKFEAYQAEAPKLSFADRVTRLNELRAAKQALQDADDFLAKLAQAATALATAHSKIKDSFDAPETKRGELTKAVGEVQSLANDLKAFNASLTKS